MNNGTYSELDYKRFLRIVAPQASPVFDYVTKNFPIFNPPEDRVYHYTSVEAAKSILESENLRLCNISHTNDENEVNYGLELIDGYVKKYCEEKKGLSISFELYYSREKSLPLIYSLPRFQEKRQS